MFCVHETVYVRAQAIIRWIRMHIVGLNETWTEHAYVWVMYVIYIRTE